MSNLKPIGSEKLTGQNKINRIMEIARFNESAPKTINENETSEYSISLADGNNYQIVRERQGYIIKKTISESETDYIEPMRNRKYYSSYSQAFKRLNLVAGELNRLNENEEGVSLYGEQKRFTLKTPKPAAPEMPAGPPEVPSTPPAVPSPELPPSPMEDMDGEDLTDDSEVEDIQADMDVPVDTEMPMDDMEGDEMPTDDMEGEDQVTFKTIQKLTGKLTQKIRVLDNSEGMTSEDIKYVINMVLSSINLGELSEEDKEDIISKFEEYEDEDYGQEDDMDGEDLTDDSEVEDIQADMDVPVDTEMAEGMYGSFGDREMEEEEEDGGYGGHGKIFDSIFGESKVDKVISKYFEVSKSEIREHTEKQVQKTLYKKSIVKKIMESVKQMTETIEQELEAEKFVTKNLNSKFVGITNKKNLVFETNGRQFKITPNGRVL